MNIKTLRKKKIGFVSLGCGKNIVELEKMISAIKEFGMEITNDPSQANIMLINSCAFLGITRKEGFDIIKEFQPLREHNLEKVIVTGCLPNYKLQDISADLQGVDLIVTQDRNINIVQEIASLYGLSTKCQYDGISRVLTTPQHYAYFRIADGCNNFCSYCTIPYITGRYKSVPMDRLIAEAKLLAQKGTKELIFVAQDITTYGIDIYGESRLIELIHNISAIDGIERIRLVYCYPEHITDELINEIKTNPKVCHYIDIPLQHISNSILKKMNRQNTYENTIRLINKFRTEIPDMTIRSTFILGFPTETEADFQLLCDFVREYKLNQLGFFAYSREKGTPAYNLKPQISQKVKDQRVQELANIQYQIVQEHNQSLLGKIFTAVVDFTSEKESQLHCDFQMPESDNCVYVRVGNLPIGSQHKVKLVAIDGYDFIGEIVI
ncbi:MAG: 30S ribosomal protein S12 methylthiotransferase RimO [Clostridia bacterium]